MDSYYKQQQEVLSFSRITVVTKPLYNNLATKLEMVFLDAYEDRLPEKPFLTLTTKY